MTEITAGSKQYKVTPDDGTKKGLYEFNARVNVIGQASYYETLYRLDMVCGTGSVTLTPPSTGFTLVQLVDKSLATTYFKLPLFTNSNPTACPITLYEAIMPTTTSLQSLVTVSTTATDIIVTPTNTATV